MTLIAYCTAVIMWVQKNPKKTRAECPPKIQYKNYRAFRAETGLELVGYPEDQKTQNGDLINPNHFAHIKEFVDLHYSVTHGKIYWRELDDEEWKAAQEECKVSPVAVTAAKKAKKKANDSAKEMAKDQPRSSKKSKKRSDMTLSDEFVRETEEPTAS